MYNEVMNGAIKIFDKYCKYISVSENMYTIKSSLPTNIYKAVMRILATNKCLSYKENKYFITENDILKITDLKEKIKENDILKDLMDNVFKRVTLTNVGGFFENISLIEYEIYSRCNFPYSYDLGKLLKSKFHFRPANILDIGGNSGGLAAAILECNSGCEITVIDKEIPCMVGEEFKDIYNIRNLTFINGDFFKLALNKTYNYIILSNILHDYSDLDCRKLLDICKVHSNSNTEIIIIEDILDTEIEPLCIVEHGLNLSINTINGQQRTINELSDLFKEYSFSIIKKEKLNNIQSVVVLGADK